MIRFLLAGMMACLAADGSSTRPQSSTVIVDVGVEEAAGRPVTKLTQSDFEVLVDSVARPIQSFSAENRPLVVVMLVDVSASMSRIPLGDDDRFRRTFESFLFELETGDRASLGRVSGKSTMSANLSGDLGALFGDVSELLKVPDVDRFGPSPLWDALAAAIDRLSTEAGSRAVILWTDGRSTGNQFGMADVADRGVAARVSVHLLLEHWPLLASPQPKSDSNACASVVSITDPTGGTCLLNLRKDLVNVPPVSAVRRVLTSLHHRYRLGFSGAGLNGQTHALEVRVKRPGLLVRAPTRYRTPK